MRKANKHKKKNSDSVLCRKDLRHTTKYLSTDYERHVVTPSYFHRDVRSSAKSRSAKYVSLLLGTFLLLFGPGSTLYERFPLRAEMLVKQQGFVISTPPPIIDSTGLRIAFPVNFRVYLPHVLGLLGNT